MGTHPSLRPTWLQLRCLTLQGLAEGLPLRALAEGFQDFPGMSQFIMTQIIH